MAATALRRRVGLGRCFVGVKRHAHGGIADGVGHDLPSVAIEQRHGLVQLLRCEARVARRAGLVVVRREHGRGMRFDDAVGDQLHRARLQQRVIGKAFPRCCQRLQFGGGDHAVDRERLVHPERQLAALAQAVVELEIFRCAAGVLHTGDADAMCLDHAGANSRDLILGCRLRRGGHQRHRGFLQRATRLTGARVLHDHAVLRVLGVPRDTCQLERLAVGPTRVTVVGHQVRGPVGHQPVEHLAGWQRPRKRLVVPTAARDPGAFGMRLGPDSDRVLNLVEGRRFEQVDLIERQPAADEVGMRIVEAGHDRAALGVDDRGLGALQALDLAVRSDANHLVAANRDRLGHVRAATACVDLAVNHDQVNRVIVRPLGADNESGDQRHADDAGHEIGRDAGRHE